MAPSVPESHAPSSKNGQIVGAVLPANGLTGYGPRGPGCGDFRFSRRARRFVLRTATGDLAAHGVNVSDTPPFGEPGIMQQTEMTAGYEPLRREVAFLARRHPGEFDRLLVLFERFEERGRLDGIELEGLRASLEQFLLRRPSGFIMEVRGAGQHHASFWPHHHADGIWFRSPKGAIGGDESGIFFRDPRGVEYFRSARFFQQRLGRGDYQLEDAATGRQVPSPIVVCDAVCERDGTVSTLMFSEVVLECFHFHEETGKLALQLQTMAKLGVVIGQPLLRVVCDSLRYLEIEG